jgi:signal peptidase I
VAVAILASLPALGLIRPFSDRGASMTPAISVGDHFIMEGFTFLARRPQRGDIVLLRTAGIPSIRAETIYIKRIAGLPGDRLRLSDGKLYANDTRVLLENDEGEIRYVSVPGERHLTSNGDTVSVPDGCYFVLGDNSADSSDSRIWGCVPRKNILGRVWFRYRPIGRFGGVR